MTQLIDQSFWDEFDRRLDARLEEKLEEKLEQKFNERFEPFKKRQNRCSTNSR